MAIGVTGASGRLGQRVVDALSVDEQTEQVIAFVREPQRFIGRVSKAVLVRRANYDEPSTLFEAFSGIDTLLMIASNAPDAVRVVQHRSVVGAAVRAGVRRLVYTSLIDADVRDTSVDALHRDTEAVIRASGMEWTMLRNAEYTENWTAWASEYIASGELAANTGGARLVTATRDDLAAAAAVVLSGGGHDGAVYDLTGAESWSFPELAAVVGAVAGRPVRYREISDIEQRQVFVRRNLPAHVTELLLDVHAQIRAGAFDRRTDHLATLIDRNPQGLRSAVESVLTGR